jgi:hypothetical protein
MKNPQFLNIDINQKMWVRVSLERRGVYSIYVFTIQVSDIQKRPDGEMAQYAAAEMRRSQKPLDPPAYREFRISLSPQISL